MLQCTDAVAMQGLDMPGLYLPFFRAGTEDLNLSLEHKPSAVLLEEDPWKTAFIEKSLGPTEFAYW